MVFTSLDPSLTPTASIGYQNVPNILDNGGFELWQRGTTFTGATNAQYTCDRWKNTFAGSVTVNMTQETSTIHSGTKALKAVISANTGFWGINQVLENYQDYRGLTVTLTVWVNTTMSNVKAFITDQVGTVVSPAANGNSTWQQLTVTRVVSGSATALAFGVSQDVTTGITGTVYVDDAMAIIGSTGIPFVPADPALDLTRCQRYYEKSYVLADAPATVTATNSEWFYGSTFGATSTRFTGHFKVQKRVAPTMTFYGTNGTLNQYSFRSSTDVNTNRTVTLNDTNTRDFQFIQTTGTEITCFGQWTAEAEI